LIARIAPGGIVAGVACVAGVAVALLPAQFVVLLIVASLGLMGLAAARAVLRPEMEKTGTEQVETPEDPHLRLPRLIYYAGAGTIGFLTVRPAAGFTASDWIFFLSFGVTCLIIVTERFRRDYFVPRAITTGVLLFAVGGLASSHEALAPFASVAVVARLLYLTLVWFWLGSIVLENRRHIETAVLAWVCSAALSSAGAVVQFFEGNVIPGGDVAWGRMTGFTPTTNNLAGLAATAFVPALLIAVDARTRGRRYVGACAVALVGSGLLLSGSIGGLTAAAVSTLLWLALRGFSQRLIVGLGAVVAAAFVLMGTTGSTSAPSPIQRVIRVTSPTAVQGAPDKGSVFTRIDGYRKAWQRIREDPIVGVGLDEASSAEVLEGRFAHNIILNSWFSAGILGLLGVVVLLAGALGAGRRVIRGSPIAERNLPAAMISSLLAFVLFAMGEPILFVRYGWFPVAMLVALRAHQLRAAATAREPVAVSHRVALSYPRGRAGHARA